MVSALAAQCPALAAVQRRYGAPPPSRRPADLATLVRIILEQQISIRAADTIYRRLRAGLGRISATALVAAGEPTLRGYGLTRQKAHYCAELGRAIRQRRFSITGVARLADDDALAALSTLKGIGPWSAAIYLMMALGRPDIWPPGDLALDRAARQLVPHGPDDPVELARRWSPYRSIAADYLWHYYRQTNGLQNRLIVNVD
ncbi:MAG: DNA-3-methyladenine glycosylase 2 family protein [Pseudomonadota bacterium]